MEPEELSAVGEDQVITPFRIVSAGREVVGDPRLEPHELLRLEKGAG